MIGFTVGDMLKFKLERKRRLERPYVLMVEKFTYTKDSADVETILKEDFETKDACVKRYKKVVEDYLEYDIGSNSYTDETGFFYGEYEVYDDANNCSYSISMFRRTS